MAQELDDGEFWLPSEFLTDDDLLMDFKTDYSKTKMRGDFSYGFGNLDLSSPVESVMGSTETESDEDDFVHGLTHKMAYSLHDTCLSANYRAEDLKLSGSPQSTLCGFKPGSYQSSPNSASRDSSPQDNKDSGWDLLYAAAGEVARMRKTEVTMPFRSSKPVATPPKPGSVTVPATKANPPTGFYSNHAHAHAHAHTHAHAQAEAHLAYLQLQAVHFQRLKQQQLVSNGTWGQGQMEYPFQNANINREAGKNKGLSMAAWPTLQQSQQQQQQRGSGMRAVFLGDTGAKNERTGTGVFLPRRFGTTPTETRKKPGCSTVLLPDKVVHALNLNLGSVDGQTGLKCNMRSTQGYDVALKQRNTVLMAQRRSYSPPQPAKNQEIRLPQEWTY